MASKFEKVLPGLKPAPPTADDVARQEKLDEIKARYTNRDPAYLAATYIKYRAEIDAIKERLSQANLYLDAIVQLIVESEQIGATGWGDYGALDNALRLVDGGTIRVQPEPYGQVKDKEAFRLWCIQNGYERQLQLWPSTMNSVCKERLVAGDNLPDGCEVFVKQKIVYTPGTKKEKS